MMFNMTYETSGVILTLSKDCVEELEIRMKPTMLYDQSKVEEFVKLRLTNSNLLYRKVSFYSFV